MHTRFLVSNHASFSLKYFYYLSRTWILGKWGRVENGSKFVFDFLYFFIDQETLWNFIIAKSKLKTYSFYDAVWPCQVKWNTGNRTSAGKK